MHNDNLTFGVGVNALGLGRFFVWSGFQCEMRIGSYHTIPTDADAFSPNSGNSYANSIDAIACFRILDFGLLACWRRAGGLTGKTNNSQERKPDEWADTEENVLRILRTPTKIQLMLPLFIRIWILICWCVGAKPVV